MNTTQRFEIRRTPEVMALIEKYDHYQDDYILGEPQNIIFSVMPHLSEWERVVLFAYAENKSIRKFASFFGVTHWTAQQTVSDIRDKVKRIYKKQII